MNPTHIAIEADTHLPEEWRAHESGGFKEVLYTEYADEGGADRLPVGDAIFFLRDYDTGERQGEVYVTDVFAERVGHKETAEHVARMLTAQVRGAVTAQVRGAVLTPGWPRYRGKRKRGALSCGPAYAEEIEQEAVLIGALAEGLEILLERKEAEP